MTIRKTSKPSIGGATPKRDRAERATDDRLVTPSRCRTKSPDCSPKHLVLSKRYQAWKDETRPESLCIILGRISKYPRASKWLRKLQRQSPSSRK